MFWKVSAALMSTKNYYRQNLRLKLQMKPKEEIGRKLQENAVL